MVFSGTFSLPSQCKRPTSLRARSGAVPPKISSQLICRASLPPPLVRDSRVVSLHGLGSRDAHDRRERHGVGELHAGRSGSPAADPLRGRVERFRRVFLARPVEESGRSLEKRHRPFGSASSSSLPRPGHPRGVGATPVSSKIARWIHPAEEVREAKDVNRTLATSPSSQSSIVRGLQYEEAICT